MSLLLGCIADDFTGATDLANNLVRAGMRVVQAIGVPDVEPEDLEADVVVVALKSRTTPAAQAVQQSLDALKWLKKAGSEQIYFKVCSTFDSLPSGNIGPVAQALHEALGADLTVVTPAFPDNGRTVFKGHLFVGDVLLNESGMQNHPLTPMTDANLVRVMQAQTRLQVGLIDYRCVAEGPQAIAARMDALRQSGCSFAIADATSNADLLRLGKAVAGRKLVVAGSGLAIGLPQNFGISASAEAVRQASRLPAAHGDRAVIAGSCSAATLAQVQAFELAGQPVHRLDPERLIDLNQAQRCIEEAVAWFDEQGRQRPGCIPMVTSTATPERVRSLQQAHGVQAIGDAIEKALAALAHAMVQRGVRQLVVAGGETSGACVQALGITQLRIGGQIDPGVPWCWARCTQVSDSQNEGGAAIHLALKSGNFGGQDFMTRAFAVL